MKNYTRLFDIKITRQKDGDQRTLAIGFDSYVEAEEYVMSLYGAYSDGTYIDELEDEWDWTIESRWV